MVPRKQQFVITKVNNHSERVCKVAGKEKNLVMLGGRRDYKGLDKSISGNTATISSEKGLVLDAAYMRQNITTIRSLPLGAGLGLDTNGTVKVFGGVEF